MSTDWAYQLSTAIRTYTLQIYVSISFWIPRGILPDESVSYLEPSNDLLFATTEFDSFGQWHPRPLLDVDSPLDDETGRIAVSPDGLWLAATDDAGSWVRILSIYDDTTPTFMHAIKETVAADKYACRLTWSPCSTTLTIVSWLQGYADSQCYFPVTTLTYKNSKWSTTTYRFPSATCINGRADVLSGVAYSPDGKSILACTPGCREDGTTCWLLSVINRDSSVVTQSELVDYGAADDPMLSTCVLDVMWSSDNTFLLAQQEARRLGVTEEPLRVEGSCTLSVLKIDFALRPIKVPCFESPAEPLERLSNGVTFSPDGSRLVVVHRNTLLVYDTCSGARLRQFGKFPRETGYIWRRCQSLKPILSPDMQYLYLGIAGVYDLQSSEGPARARGHCADETLRNLATIEPSLRAWHTYSLAEYGGAWWIQDDRQRRIISVPAGDVIAHGNKLFILYSGQLLILRLHPSLQN